MSERDTQLSAGVSMRDLVTRDELHEVRTEQALLRQAIEQIADSIERITASTETISQAVQRFTALSERFEDHLEQSETVRREVEIQGRYIEILKSHDIVKKVEAHDRDMPGLLEVRGWIIKGVLAIVAAVCMAAAAVILS